jgi:hypothetical protein
MAKAIVQPLDVTEDAHGRMVLTAFSAGVRSRLYGDLLHVRAGDSGSDTSRGVYHAPRDNSEPMEEYVPGTCPDCGGLILTTHGSTLLVEPRSGLTDELRALIRAEKPAILEELAAEAAERRKAIKSARDAAPLSEYDAALILGRLYLCGNCAAFQFFSDPAGLGRCSSFKVETWPFIPFWCAGFEASRTPAAPDYLPDPDGARASAKEYSK